MKSDEILLNEIYQNSITAINVLSDFMKKAEDEQMFDFLFDKMTEYRKIGKSAYDMLEQDNLLPKKNNNYSHIAILASIGNPSTNRLARILLDGSTEGFFSLIDSINSCTNAKKETRQLAYRLLAVEDGNIHEMKKYLGYNVKEYLSAP